MSKTKQEHIDEIMDWFDFGKVTKVMELLDWKWSSTGGGVPIESEIRGEARGLLSVAYDSPCGVHSTGGLRACYYEEFGQMHLSFAISEWTTNE